MSLEKKLQAALDAVQADKEKKAKAKQAKALKPAGGTGKPKKAAGAGGGAKAKKPKAARAPGLYMKGKIKAAKREAKGAGKAVGVKVNGKVLFKALEFTQSFVVTDQTISADGKVVYALQPQDVVVIEEIACPSVVNTF